jgi:UDP-N-acetyl-2-amino-2-deoxyglucuronate dehydrogenase
MVNKKERLTSNSVAKGFFRRSLTRIEVWYDYENLEKGGLVKIQVGIIGYGTVSKAHIEALNSIDNVSVSAIYSAHLSGSELEGVEKCYGVTVYSGLNMMLADPAIQVVSICSRPDKHAEHAVAAAKAGKHIILEKPIALSWPDCLRVQTAADEAGVMVSVCFECRYCDQLLKTKAVTDSKIGEITYCEAGYFHGIGPDNRQFAWNTTKACGGSSLLSAGCHALDAVLFLMGDAVVESVSSAASSIRHPRYERYEYPPHQFTTIAFSNGAIGYVPSSIGCNQPYEFPIRVVGTEGTIRNDRVFQYTGTKPDPKEWQEVPMKLLQSGDVADHPYREQFAEFIGDIVAKNHAAIASRFQAAMSTHRVIFAADLSAQRKTRVQMNELDGLLQEPDNRAKL